jgi:cytochrome P450
VTAIIDFDPFSAAMSADPYPVYRHLRNHDPVHFGPARQMWALSRYDDVRAALRDSATFSSMPSAELNDLGTLFASGGNMLDADPPLHEQLRRVVRFPFAPRQIATLEPEIAGHVDRLLDGLAANAADSRGAADFAQGLAWKLPTEIISLLLGVPAGYDEQLLDWLHLLQHSEPGQTNLSAEAHAASPVISAFFLELIEHKQRFPADDVLTHLGTALSSGALSREQIPGMCSLLFTAGIETTAGLISNGLLALAEFPGERRQLADNPDLIADAIEELLRFDPSVQYLARTTTRSITIGDTTIPGNERVVLLYASANRDESQFPDPDVLRVTRRPQGHLSFGDGLHRCLGAPLARLEGKVTIERVLSRFPDYELNGTAEIAPGLSLRALSHLPVTVN